MRRPVAPGSLLVDRRWKLSLGEVWVSVPTADITAKVDATWGPLRAPGEPSFSWNWTQICAACPERFALRAADGSVLGIWASAKFTPRLLPCGMAYRIDWLEVDPARRGAGLGRFVLSLVACRAIERGATVVVYGSHPHASAVHFHRAIGAKEGPVTGWSAPENLVPFSLPRDALETLALRAHDQET